MLELGLKASVVILDNKNSDYIIGKIYSFPISNIVGVVISEEKLRNLSFTDSDEREWTLVYWFEEVF